MKIRNKFIAALLIAGLLIIGSMVLLTRWSVEQGMIDYVNTRQQQKLQAATEVLAQWYQKKGSWQQMNRRQLHELMRAQLDPVSIQATQPNPPIRLNSSGEQSALNQAGDNLGPPSADKQHPDWRRPPPRPHRSLQPHHRPPNKHERLAGPPHSERRPPPSADGGRKHPPRPDTGTTLYGPDKKILLGRLPWQQATLAPIVIDTTTLGWIGIPQQRDIGDGFELQFIEQQQQALLVFAALILIVAAAIALPLARHILIPIQQLALGAHRLTQGQYDSNINCQRRDELGSLARDFNELARALADSDSNRKRWLADISHELRTPVAILRGELEAMLDGVRPTTTEAIHSLHQETQQLQRLIEDLHQLNATDLGSLEYRKQNIALAPLLQETCNKYQPLLAKRNIQLELSDNPHIELWGDASRLRQLLDNLLNNCSKYSASDGRVRISSLTRRSTAGADEGCEIRIEDSGPGVEEQQLGLLFEPLYRTDPARSEREQSTGLGLAICDKIVRAHQGRIYAAHSSLGGLAIVIVLPRSS